MRGIRVGFLSSCFLFPLLAVALAGCFCNGPYSAVVEWKQGGIYGDFPPEGEHGDYRIDWHERPSPNRLAFREDGTNENALHVDADGNASFRVIREYNDGRISVREFYGLMNRTFDDLGISVRPRPPSKVRPSGKAPAPANVTTACHPSGRESPEIETVEMNKERKWHWYENRPDTGYAMIEMALGKGT